MASFSSLECPWNQFVHLSVNTILSCRVLDSVIVVLPFFSGCTNGQYHTFQMLSRTGSSGLALSDCEAGTFVGRSTVLDFLMLSASMIENQVVIS